jgi:hypothetical protein
MSKTTARVSVFLIYLTVFTIVVWLEGEFWDNVIAMATFLWSFNEVVKAGEDAPLYEELDEYY